MFTRKLFIISIFCVLSSCVSSVDQLRKVNLKANTFQNALARQYLAFAEAEADQYDWFDSAYFARKGLKAINDEDPPPENLDFWSVGDDVKPILQQARDYLVSVITPDVTLKYPEHSATAQFMFDCWVEQQEEGWQQEDIAKCKDGFYNTLDNLFALTTGGTNTEERPAGPVEEKTEKAAQETRIAYFKTGSFALDDGTKRLISTVISRLKDVGNYDITLNAYADSVGGEEYNMDLSKKRALAIKKALIDAGLTEKSITIFAFGKSEARVKTRNGIPSKENRAVEIVVEMR